MAVPALKMSDAIYAELTATCDALGYNDGSKVHLDKNSIGKISLKDLIVDNSWYLGTYPANYN